MAEIYQTTQQNVSLHLQGIYEDKELDDESTHKKFLLVRQEGKRQVKRDMPGDRTCQGTGSWHHFVDNWTHKTGKLLSHMKYSSKRSDFLRFYLYLCHAIEVFACLEMQH